jgi:hypothetical protein
MAVECEICSGKADEMFKRIEIWSNDDVLYNLILTALKFASLHRYLSRSSEFASSIVNQCAVICDTCAQECEEFPNLPHCVECAEV